MTAVRAAFRLRNHTAAGLHLLDVPESAGTDSPAAASPLWLERLRQAVPGQWIAGVYRRGPAERIEQCETTALRCRCLSIRCGHRRAVPVPCNQAFCPRCQRRRAAMMVDRYAPLFAHEPYVRHYTLTTPTVPLDCHRAALVIVRRSFRDLRLAEGRRDVWRKVAYAIETTGRDHHRGRPGRWHVHIHALVAGGYLSQERLCELWEAAHRRAYEWFTRKFGSPGYDYAPAKHTWIRAVVVDGRGRVEDGLRECLKYAVHGFAAGDDEEHATAGWSGDMMREYLESTRHARLVQLAGEAQLEREEEQPLQCERCKGPAEWLPGVVPVETAREWVALGGSPYGSPLYDPDAQPALVYDGRAGAFVAATGPPSGA